MILLTAIVFLTGVAKLEEAYYRDYFVWSSKQMKDFDAERLTVQAVQTNYDDEIQPLRITENERERTYIIYELDEGDIFTVENLKEIHKIEQLILTHPSYGKFCQAQSSSDSS